MNPDENPVVDPMAPQKPVEGDAEVTPEAAPDQATM
jgi:hypothetical protein